ncbi:MAG: c-type cytochrome [Acidobacteriota bacterium]|nr:MAG: c-type cytochrome [Acidobacteriota bacterium]
MANSFRAKLTAAALLLSFAGSVFLYATARSFAAPGGGLAVPTPTPETFDQAAAVANLRESIKGRENEPAGKVFKNVKNLAEMPAGRLLAVMQFGYSRSLGVDCTHCHTPDEWSSDSRPQKQIARDMHVMAGRINNELLKGMQSLGGRQAIVNCTTCHRGQVKPATNLPGN